MLTEGGFSTSPPTIGLEVELNLVDDLLQPAMANTVVLEKLDDPSFTTELGQHNLELNVLPRPLSGDQARELETELRVSLTDANVKAQDAGAALVMIGTLPTLREEHFKARWLSTNARYSRLNDQIFAARGEDMVLSMEGPAIPGQRGERLRSSADSILPEAACTSAQLHLQVPPEEFASHWNAAQCLAGVQVAIAANSPFLLRKALWHETRIPLFQQATDTRPQELKNQGVRPRVWFGERWITSIFDLFEENVRYFPGLLPEIDDEDPIEALNAGRAPKLAELRLHNGTIWRWNRPVYDVVDGIPHLRVENRVLPAGPTVVDLIANAAFFYGAQRALATAERPVWTQMSFQAAEENLYAGARHAFDAQLYWPGIGWVPPDELVLRRLLPMAHDGLRECGVSDAVRERYLGVIEQRCLAQRTGSTWQRETVAALEARGLDRDAALVGMLHRYVELSDTNAPVHTWAVT
ncbi:gamma-glutamyl:cysteine ligase YbdK (ATP-grasp superfamily) [Actinophytocola algeriensis]|uniref:Gamma-glutamyl:cysteine ligase YbdK (ATP-grasp superfamily) n=2 Tax=Actinophytocola algeriensis TaxID=1768010 RepID=A0A7W7QFK1_9PSEU|nr:gamma-glutamyl:cysteine ligase YbdK (ATP-grasp superfamily) [Actinophytocola algeriensis]MBE1478907.1 gamma-glutamyl:cysteine ligase YbdK (ATP-grasp superfamily) [Actinophytocola algeriensis]